MTPLVSPICKDLGGVPGRQAASYAFAGATSGARLRHADGRDGGELFRGGSWEGGASEATPPPQTIMLPMEFLHRSTGAEQAEIVEAGMADSNIQLWILKQYL